MFKKTKARHITDLTMKKEPLYQISIYWKGKIVCEVFGISEYQVNNRADMIIKGLSDQMFE